MLTRLYKTVNAVWCGLKRRTGQGGRTGVALAAELLQGVDSYVEVDVFTATAIIHQLLLVKGLKHRKARMLRTTACSAQAPPQADRLLFLPSGRQRPLMDRI